MNYWLMKSEPETYSIDHLMADPNHCEPWDGVRNYQARNMMRDQMAEGDLVFFYHSNCKVPGVVGVMKVANVAHPDHTAMDSTSNYFDEKHTTENPRWFCVDVQFVEKFAGVISLTDLKANPALAEMALVRKGNRLSVMPVSEDEWAAIMEMRLNFL